MSPWAETERMRRKKTSVVKEKDRAIGFGDLFIICLGRLYYILEFPNLFGRAVLQRQRIVSYDNPLHPLGS